MSVRSSLACEKTACKPNWKIASFNAQVCHFWVMWFLQSAVLNWPRPVGLHAITCFLGFLNYYKQFIPHFSTLVAPISALAKKSRNPYIWTFEAENAFSHLKGAFVSATVLHRPDPDKLFFLELDASSIRAGAVVSLRNYTGETIIWRLAAERNYTIGDQEFPRDLHTRIPLQHFCKLYPTMIYSFQHIFNSVYFFPSIFSHIFE